MTDTAKLIFHPLHHRHPRFWHRVTLYVATLLISAAILVFAAYHFVRYQPERIVRDLLNQLPYAHRFSKVEWQNGHTLVVNNLAIGLPGHEFFDVDQLIVSFTWPGLARRELLQVRFVAPQLFLSRLNTAMEKNKVTPNSSGLDWILQTVTLEHGTIWLENIGSDHHLIPLRVGIRHPVELHEIHLNDLGKGEAGQKIQTAEIENVYLISPFDPLTPVASFPLTRVEFTYAGLWQHKIQRIQCIRPVIYMGSDLFSFLDEMNKPNDKTPATTPDPHPWAIDTLSVHYGQLGISAFGQQAVEFPFYFQTTANHVQLDQLNHITLQNNLKIARFDHDYPEYKLNIKNLNGDIIFNLPPSVDATENIVQTVAVEEMSWNGIPATNLTSTLLFDRTGIFGNFSGLCHGGKIQGNIGISYASGFPWAANLTAEHIDVAPISQRLAPNYLELTGIIQGELNLRGASTTVKSCTGLLSLPHPGVMHLNSLKGLLNNLPGGVATIQGAVLDKLVESLQVYPYENGTVTTDYQETGGEIALKLSGPTGKRDFEVFWHPSDADRSN